MSRPIVSRTAAGAAALLVSSLLAAGLFPLGSAYAEGHEKCDADDRGPAGSGATLPPNNIVACFGAKTMDALNSCPTSNAQVQQVPLLSVNFQVQNPTGTGGAGGGAGGGKVTSGPFSFTKHVDTSTPTLFQKLSTNSVYDSVSVTFYDSTGKAVQWFQFKLVSITSLNYVDAVAPDGTPVESGTFSASEMATNL